MEGNKAEYGLTNQAYAQARDEIGEMMKGPKDFYVPGANAVKLLLSCANSNSLFAQVVKSHPKDVEKPNLEIKLRYAT